MAVDTGIKWTDSTSNPWWGCTKVENAPACFDCYAEDVDKRGTPADQPLHWGHGAPRRRIGEKSRNAPLLWNRDADKFRAEHGRAQRVFCMSMGDLFDNEVDDEWRNEHFNLMMHCDRLEWQICTKRVSQIPKMVPRSWHPKTEIIPIASYSDGVGAVPGLVEHRWPKHIGVLITVVTQKEADRDIPRLLRLKSEFGIPWVGISYEPAQEFVDFREFIGMTGEINHSAKLGWIIFGGKSGSNWNDGPFELRWAEATLADCRITKTPFFMKQVAAFRPNDSMIPADLMVRQWPEGH